MMRTVRNLFFLVIVGVLAGCVASVDAWDAHMVAAKPPTPELKKVLLEAARDRLFDPGSIRDAEISNVFLFNAKYNTHAVCVKFNSKNRMGGYTGRVTWGIIVKDNQPTDMAVNWYACQNKWLKWQIFKEANGLKSL